jgi:hypothetical protein
VTIVRGRNWENDKEISENMGGFWNERKTTLFSFSFGTRHYSPSFSPTLLTSDNLKKYGTVPCFHPHILFLAHRKQYT